MKKQEDFIAKMGFVNLVSVKTIIRNRMKMQLS